MINGLEMTNKLISEESARIVVLENIMHEFEGRLRLLESPEEIGVPIYTCTERSFENYYIYCVDPEKPSTGSSRIICVSKNNGEIVFDGEVGE